MKKHIAKLDRGSKFILHGTTYTFNRTLDLHTAEVINNTTGAIQIMRKFTLVQPA